MLSRRSDIPPTFPELDVHSGDQQAYISRFNTIHEFAR